VLRTISDGTDQVEVLFDDEQVRFRVDDSEITSRLIEGSYPKYQQLIPATSETQARVKMDDFSRIVKIAGLFARNSGGSVTVTVDGEKNNISIHSIASELGENTSSADAEVTGGGVLTLNSRYITDALGVIDGDSVDFRFSGKLSPCVLSPASENSDYIHIIMPLKS
jgi:DNA polymerase III subunit beta